jgi:hypothetical protein
MTITVGSRVYLRGARGCGAAGVVIREEQKRMVVYWEDLDFWSRHRPESLELAKEQPTDSQEAA